MLLRLGTRGSTLALTQSGLVAELLRAKGHQVELVTISTKGDRDRGSLTALAGLGVFAAELRTALLAGECDFAVHSLKDLPVAPVAGLEVVAIPARQDPRDGLCARDGLRFAELPAGAKIGTGSPRRVAQLRALRPDLEYVDIRGNVDTRLSRVAAGDLDAVVLAVAGLNRLGLQARITDYLDILPAPGQGALALECRSQDQATRAALRELNDPATEAAVLAERETLAQLGGGCAAPIGALGTVIDERVELRAGVFSSDGANSAQVQLSQPSAELVGRLAAEQLLAQGAAEICDLGEGRQSRLAEFHDQRQLWPADKPQPTVLLPRKPGELGPRLQAMGIKVLATEVLQTVTLATPGPLPELAAADWVAITSARTVQVLEQLGWRLPTSCKLAAVGAATAAALSAAGYQVDLVPTGNASAADLLAAFPEGAGRVWLPGSQLAGPTLANGLRAKGWQVEVTSIYTVEPVESLPPEVSTAWQAGEVAGVLVSSGSVARAIEKLLGWQPGIRVLALGAPSAAVLAELGIAAAVCPSQEPLAVAEAMCSLLQKGQP